jgi:RNA polymerase sigma-70 factor (ECF subfamily)
MTKTLSAVSTRDAHSAPSQQDIGYVKPLKKTPMKSDIKVWNNHLSHLGRHQDRDSFQLLFNHFSPLLKNYFIGKFPTQSSFQMIDELIQEVMIKVWQKSASYDASKAAASTWIFTLARNTRIDMLRRQNKYAGTTSIEVEDIWEDTTENGPYTFLTQKRNEEYINTALEQLPYEQKLVITKVYMESKSHADIAKELELPLGTVKSRVRLAQNKLHHLLSAMTKKPNELL